ncbi:hypothetical protein L5876_10615 [Hyphobacterium sp. SN044]|uniref:hypothetical protein n=1 Tax=Hyphobacterium sp. SN044 TaxID=2912575 RepID=UPI001F3D839F|nr:hypothetical protein [Hyphobacterium sp. SN044]MCF8880268.1 hypothetical protein [Hyphobacterium sp. SN044]
MLAEIARYGVVAFGLFLILAAGWMAVRPAACRAILAKMGSTPLIHYGEHAVRALGGLCLIGAASASKAPLILTVAGGFIVVSSIVIALAPRRWHAAYAVWWADRLPLWIYPALAPVSLIGGAALIWVVL